MLSQTMQDTMVTALDWRDTRGDDPLVVYVDRLGGKRATMATKKALVARRLALWLRYGTPILTEEGVKEAERLRAERAQSTAR